MLYCVLNLVRCEGAAVIFQTERVGGSHVLLSLAVFLKKRKLRSRIKLVLQRDR